MWHKNLNSLRIDANTACWLQQAFILSDEFIRHGLPIELKIKKLGFALPNKDELDKLELKADEQIYLREVNIASNNINLTYARVAVPYVTYKANSEQFKQLNNKLIGKTMLYNRDNIKRLPFEFAVLEKTPARRSIFLIDNNPLLITEFFLSTLPSYKI